MRTRQKVMERQPADLTNAGNRITEIANIRSRYTNPPLLDRHARNVVASLFIISWYTIYEGVLSCQQSGTSAAGAHARIGVKLTYLTNLLKLMIFFEPLRNAIDRGRVHFGALELAASSSLHLFTFGHADLPYNVFGFACRSNRTNLGTLRFSSSARVGASLKNLDPHARLRRSA